MTPLSTPILRLHARARGHMLALLVFLLVMFAAIASLAVDYGHVQMIKSEMQRTADAVARGYMTYYMNSGQSYANTNGPALYSSANNPIDSNSGTAPTVTVTWGYWSPGTSTFSTSSGTDPAIKVTITRTSSGGNAAPLFWGRILGMNSVDLHASSIAAEMGGQSSAMTIPSTASLYLAGMGSGSSAGGGDTLSNAAPYQESSIPVTPGTYISFTSLTGTTSVCPGSMAYAGPAGLSTYAVNHGVSWNGSPNTPMSENGVADAKIYEDATAGVFLTDNAPNATSAPTSNVDWTSSTLANKAVLTTLQVQAPFCIGNGQTTGGVVKQFLVPPGATRLFIGIWDGYEYNNNGGSLSGTVTALHYIQLVQ